MIEITEAKLRSLLALAWELGFDESGEGYNGESLREGELARVTQAKNTDVLYIMRDIYSPDPEDY